MSVRDSSRSNPFGASLTGSWSKRARFTGAISMKPWELTNVAVDARVNEGTENVTGAGVTNGILFEMKVVSPMGRLRTPNPGFFPTYPVHSRTTNNHRRQRIPPAKTNDL